MNSAFMTTERCLREEGAICTNWNTDCLLEDFSDKNHENVFNYKLKQFDNVIVRIPVLESECSFTKYVSLCPNTKYSYLRLKFLKMKKFRIIILRLFSVFGKVW